MHPPSPHRLFTPEGGDAEPLFRIGLAPIPEEAWFEGGEDNPAARKDAVFASHPVLCWGETDGSRAGQAEAAAMVANWLGKSSIKEDGAPLWLASRLVPDDLCLMEKRGGEWTLTAASLCAPSFFSARDAVGLPLSGLHAPVPGFNDRLLERVSRIFDRLGPEVVLERRNWSVVNSDALFLPSSQPLREQLGRQSSDEAGADLVVRRERQTLRRLVQTGGLLFTIRVWREPLGEVLSDPARRAAFAAAWTRLMSAEAEDFRTYKHLNLLDPAVRALLDRP
jgi:hypothetical protein